MNEPMERSLENRVGLVFLKQFYTFGHINRIWVSNDLLSIV